MPYNARLTYASTSTSKPDTLRKDLIDILKKASSHNATSSINGVLYYGNDYFFQCIEGRKSKVNELFNKICDDERHTNIVVLSYHEVEHLSFTDWQMKFIRQDEEIQQFFNSQWEVFNPYSLFDGMINQFVELLIQKDNAYVPEDKPAIKPEKHPALTSHYVPVVAFMAICLVITAFSLYILYK